MSRWGVGAGGSQWCAATRPKPERLQAATGGGVVLNAARHAGENQVALGGVWAWKPEGSRELGVRVWVVPPSQLVGAAATQKLSIKP